MSLERPDVRLFGRDFSPGYLDTPESDTLPLGATPDAKNWTFENADVGGLNRSPRAVLRKRKGSFLLNPTVMASEKKVDGVFDFRRAGQTAVLLAMCNGELFSWDGSTTFSSIGSGWTAGNAARQTLFRNNAVIYDGDFQRRYDGSSLFELGFAKPTGVTNMSAVAPSGSGVTGDYEARYTWYDSTMNHESSITDDTTATLTCSSQARRHTKPSGSPPSNVTHWRAYVRRVDTNEINFYRVGTVAVGTGTLDEEVADTARVDLWPRPSENDPPPVTFAILTEWRGWGIGVAKDADSYYVSKRGDLESWHPKDVFPVSEGDGEYLRSVTVFGTDLLVQKGHSSYRLVGDRLPFTLETLHPRFGNVSQDAGIEVNDRFYAWDRERGPYVTDTVNWRALGDHRIENILDTVNRSELGDIRVAHDTTRHLIIWAVPTTGSARKRTLLCYQYLLDSWLPPITGMEYGSLTEFTTSGGALDVYFGDYWGRVYRLFSGEREGVPVGSPTDHTLTATVTSATSSTVTVSGASFYTTGNGMAGMPVAVKSPGGAWQWRRIKSNTATVITLDTTNDAAWTTTPTSDYEVTVGGIEWVHKTPWLDAGVPELQKTLWHIYLQGKATSTSHNVDVHARYNDDEGTIDSADLTFPTGQLSGLWGDLIWGTGLWGGTVRTVLKKRLERAAFTAQFQFSNFYPDQPVHITGYGLTADGLPRRRASSGSTT